MLLVCVEEKKLCSAKSLAENQRFKSNPVFAAFSLIYNPPLRNKMSNSLLVTVMLEIMLGWRMCSGAVF